MFFCSVLGLHSDKLVVELIKKQIYCNLKHKFTFYINTILMGIVARYRSNDCLMNPY